jgi:hypothetical protein
MTKTLVPFTIAVVLAALAGPARAAGVEDSTLVVQKPTDDPTPGGEVDFVGGRAFRRKTPLVGADFYLAVDRPDLAERYRVRALNKEVGSVTGGLALTAGLAWGLLDGLGTGLRNGLAGRNDEVSPFPWITAGAGLGLLLVSAGISPDPVSESERMELVRAHNNKAVTLVPQLEPGGAGLAMVGRF